MPCSLTSGWLCDTICDRTDCLLLRRVGETRGQYERIGLVKIEPEGRAIDDGEYRTLLDKLLNRDIDEIEEDVYESYNAEAHR